MTTVRQKLAHDAAFEAVRQDCTAFNGIEEMVTAGDDALFTLYVAMSDRSLVRLIKQVERNMVRVKLCHAGAQAYTTAYRKRTGYTNPELLAALYAGHLAHLYNGEYSLIELGEVKTFKSALPLAL